MKQQIRYSPLFFDSIYYEICQLKAPIFVNSRIV